MSACPQPSSSDIRAVPADITVSADIRAIPADIPAWTDRPKPGRRKGGEAGGLRAMYAVIAERYGT